MCAAGACWETESVVSVELIPTGGIFQRVKLQTKKTVRWRTGHHVFTTPFTVAKTLRERTLSISVEQIITHQVSWLLNFFVTTFPSSSPSRSAIFCDRSGWELPLKILMFGILGWSVVPILSEGCTVFYKKHCNLKRSIPNQRMYISLWIQMAWCRLSTRRFGSVRSVKVLCTTKAPPTCALDTPTDCGARWCRACDWTHFSGLDDWQINNARHEVSISRSLQTHESDPKKMHNWTKVVCKQVKDYKDGFNSR